jgi:hypothetical protein
MILSVFVNILSWFLLTTKPDADTNLTDSTEVCE